MQRPVTEPPGTDPPGTQRPGREPPGRDPPGTQPPGTQPPGTDPPGTDPPGREPPALPPMARRQDESAPGRGRPQADARGRPEAQAVAAGATAAWHRQFAQVIIEVLAGLRPSRQITSWTTERVRTRIDDLSQMLIPDHRPRIRRVVTSRPSALVVEMTVVVGLGPRSRALAMRFERMPPRPAAPGRLPRPARWLCTELEAL